MKKQPQRSKIIRVSTELVKELDRIRMNEMDCSRLRASKIAARFLKDNQHRFGGEKRSFFPRF